VEAAPPRPSGTPPAPRPRPLKFRPRRNRSATALRSFSFKRTKAFASKGATCPQAGSDSVAVEVVAHKTSRSRCCRRCSRRGRCTPCSGGAQQPAGLEWSRPEARGLPGQDDENGLGDFFGQIRLAAVGARRPNRPSREPPRHRVFTGVSRSVTRLIRPSRVPHSPRLLPIGIVAQGLSRVSTMQTARGSFTRRLHAMPVILPRTQGLVPESTS